MRSRFVAAIVAACLLIQVAAPAGATVNVNRNGDENPMKEVATSVIYGGLAGLMIGSAIAWANEGSEHDADYIRGGFVAGTFLGLGVGLWWVTKRPQPTAALELKDGALRASLPTPMVGADGRPRVMLARVRF